MKGKNVFHLLLTVWMILWLSGCSFGPFRCTLWNASLGSDLSACDFSGKDLSGRDLSGANLSGANLNKANLANANLSGANLSKANLANANLSGANLTGADLTDAVLDNAILVNANLSRVNLAGRDFSVADLRGAIFVEANLGGAIMTSAMLSDTMSIRADLSMANLAGADLSNANLAGANLTQANLTDANLKSAVLAYASLDDAILINADLSEANLLFANLTNANLTGALLADTTLVWARLISANLSEASLIGTDLINADIVGANLSGANLTDADLNNADLTRAILDRAVLDRSTLIGTKGITDEILAAALEIRTDELYLATAQRQIRLESPQDIASQLKPLCLGEQQGLNDAVALQPVTPTTVFVLNTLTWMGGLGNRELTLSDNIGIVEPMAARFAELIVCVGEKFELIETCQYIGGPPIVRKQWHAQIKVIETRTGHVLEERTLMGPMPDECPYLAPADQESILGDPVSTYELLRELSTMSFSVSDKTISLESVSTKESLNETVRTWKILPDGGLMHPLQEDGEFTNAELLSVAFSPDATLLVTTSRDPTNMRLWRVSDGTRLRSLYSDAYQAAISPDGALVAARELEFLPSRGLYEYLVRLWRVSDGTILRTLKGAKNSVEDVAFSPDSAILAGADWDGTIYLWRVSDGVLLDTMRPHTDKVVDMAFSPDGTLLASASEDGTVELSRVGAFFARVHTLKHTEGENVESVAFSPDGSLLASVADNQVWLWRVADGMLLQTLQGTEGWFQDVTFSADGKVLATIAWPNLGYNGYTTSLQLWRVSDNTLLRTLRIKQWERGAGAAFSPDGRYLLAANQDGLFIWPIGEK